MRTARARTSEENLFVVLLIMAPPSQGWEPPANPVRFKLERLIDAIETIDEFADTPVSGFVDMRDRLTLQILDQYSWEKQGLADGEVQELAKRAAFLLRPILLSAGQAVVALSDLRAEPADRVQVSFNRSARRVRTLSGMPAARFHLQMIRTRTDRDCSSIWRLG
jgi:hypothetical protein